MHHKLDFHPIPTDVLYVNELSLAGKTPYETKQDMDKALTGRTKSTGGIRQCEDLCADGSECRHYYVAAIFAA